jgi:hypothetical protein
MIESGLILTGNDADLLRRALSVKTKVYEESGTRLDDTQAFDALVSSFRNAETEGSTEPSEICRNQRHGLFRAFSFDFNITVQPIQH